MRAGSRAAPSAPHSAAALIAARWSVPSRYEEANWRSQSDAATLRIQATQRAYSLQWTGIRRRYPVHVRRDRRLCLSDSYSSHESHTYPFVGIAKVSGDELKLPIDGGRIFSVSGAPGSQPLDVLPFPLGGSPVEI